MAISIVSIPVEILRRIIGKLSRCIKLYCSQTTNVAKIYVAKFGYIKL